MRLIDAETISLEEFLDEDIPKYAILSHTWEDQEVTFQDMHAVVTAATLMKRKRGYAKIKFACQQARKNGLGYVWIDTCCIDKRSSAELQEAINSMFRWYKRAEQCYVFLSDVSETCPILEDLQYYRDLPFKGGHAEFANSRWFTRGWTLQELIAPRHVLFFGRKWNSIGTRDSLIGALGVITGIDHPILAGSADVSSISVARRMSWASKRKTSRTEDIAYCLLGIFNVNMPMLYGEGSRAFIRLQEEIIKTSNDHSIFAWDLQGNGEADGRLLAKWPLEFSNARKIVLWGKPGTYAMTNRGLQITLKTVTCTTEYTELMAILNCRFANDLSGALALRLRNYAGGDEYHTMVGRPPSQPQIAPLSNVKYYSRLTFINESDIGDVSPVNLQITREFEPEASKLKFWIPLIGSGFRVVKVYPEELWDVHDGVFHARDGRRQRGGIILERPSGIKFTLIFGFDRPRPENVDDESEEEIDKDRLLPAIWGTRSTDSKLLENECENSKPCEHRHVSCLKNGCPLMPTKTTVYKHPEPELLEAHITRAQIMEDSVFIITATVHDVHEIEDTSDRVELDLSEVREREAGPDKLGTFDTAEPGTSVNLDYVKPLASQIYPMGSATQDEDLDVLTMLKPLRDAVTEQRDAPIQVFIRVEASLKIERLESSWNRLATRVYHHSAKDFVASGVLLQHMMSEDQDTRDSVWQAPPIEKEHVILVFIGGYHLALLAVRASQDLDTAYVTMQAICSRIWKCYHRSSSGSSNSSCSLPQHHGVAEQYDKAYIPYVSQGLIFCAKLRRAEVDGCVAHVIDVNLLKRSDDDSHGRPLHLVDQLSAQKTTAAESLLASMSPTFSDDLNVASIYIKADDED